jgi:8-oxo-dGTP pyrophosphatase MutT (NUDIX family)
VTTPPPDDPPDVRTLASRVVYENPWMSVTEDDVQRRDGSIGQYGVVHSRDFVLVIPFDGERFHLVEQYRYPVGARLWEFPQGSVPGGETLPPEALAEIELAEETGLHAGRLELLGFLHHGYGRSTNGFHAFYATDLRPGPAAREIEEQDMRSGTFTIDELWALVADGTMTDAASLAALALLGRRREIVGPTEAG